MELKYSEEKNVQILLALLKAHNIRRIILNPGSSNLAFSGSVQNDDWFQCFSGVDERHSAYLACGMAVESGEPVVLNCTGATSSRNYMPALTEAYYRKIPILVVTSSQPSRYIGQLIPQVTDRLHLPTDIVRFSVNCLATSNENDAYTVRILNEAILELRRHGGGPVHINLEMSYNTRFTVQTLPLVRRMVRIYSTDKIWPELKRDTKIAVWIGAHKSFTVEEAAALEAFVMRHNVVVLCDHTSSYHGERRIQSALLCSQGLKDAAKFANLKPDLIVHIGEISGDAPTATYLTNLAPVWRVSADGEIRDTLSKIECVFEMNEDVFFDHYSQENISNADEYYKSWHAMDEEIRSRIPVLPFSNPMIARELARLIPSGSRIHFGILNSLRSWNYFNILNQVETMSNVGGFGIDGCVSSLVGASLVDASKLYFGVFGDLAFFYDMNALGNRHIGKNLRLLVVNNGAGAEFNMYNNPTSQFAEHTNNFIAAGGHFGSKSPKLIRDYATDLGYEYFAASSADEFAAALPRFTSVNSDRSILLECFTDLGDESEALRRLNTIEHHVNVGAEIRKIVPAPVKQLVKKVFIR